MTVRTYLASEVCGIRAYAEPGSADATARDLTFRPGHKNETCCPFRVDLSEETGDWSGIESIVLTLTLRNNVRGNNQPDANYLIAYALAPENADWGTDETGYSCLEAMVWHPFGQDPNDPESPQAGKLWHGQKQAPPVPFPAPNVDYGSTELARGHVAYALQKGDTIALTLPATDETLEQLQRGLLFFVEHETNNRPSAFADFYYIGNTAPRLDVTYTGYIFPQGFLFADVELPNGAQYVTVGVREVGTGLVVRDLHVFEWIEEPFTASWDGKDNYGRNIIDETKQYEIVVVKHDGIAAEHVARYGQNYSENIADTTKTTGGNHWGMVWAKALSSGNLGITYRMGEGTPAYVEQNPDGTYRRCLPHVKLPQGSSVFIQSRDACTAILNGVECLVLAQRQWICAWKLDVTGDLNPTPDYIWDTGHQKQAIYLSSNIPDRIEVLIPGVGETLACEVGQPIYVNSDDEPNTINYFNAPTVEITVEPNLVLEYDILDGILRDYQYSEEILFSDYRQASNTLYLLFADRVETLNLATGHRTPIVTLGPSDRSGLHYVQLFVSPQTIAVNEDGSFWVTQSFKQPNKGVLFSPEGTVIDWRHNNYYSVPACWHPDPAKPNHLFYWAGKDTPDFMLSQISKSGEEVLAVFSHPTFRDFPTCAGDLDSRVAMTEQYGLCLFNKHWPSVWQINEANGTLKPIAITSRTRVQAGGGTWAIPREYAEAAGLDYDGNPKNGVLYWRSTAGEEMTPEACTYDPDLDLKGGSGRANIGVDGSYSHGYFGRDRPQYDESTGAQAGDIVREIVNQDIEGFSPLYDLGVGNEFDPATVIDTAPFAGIVRDCLVDPNDSSLLYVLFHEGKPEDGTKPGFWNDRLATAVLGCYSFNEMKWLWYRDVTPPTRDLGTRRPWHVGYPYRLVSVWRGLLLLTDVLGNRAIFFSATNGLPVAPYNQIRQSPDSYYSWNCEIFGGMMHPDPDDGRLAIGAVNSGRIYQIEHNTDTYSEQVTLMRTTQEPPTPASRTFCFEGKLVETTGQEPPNHQYIFSASIEVNSTQSE